MLPETIFVILLGMSGGLPAREREPNADGATCPKIRHAKGADAPAPDEKTSEEATLTPKTWIDDYDALLQKYVTGQGVRYKAWHASAGDRATLRKVIDEISAQDVSTMDKDERRAFYLNAYNAWILHRILQDYPTGGPGGRGFFGRNKFRREKISSKARVSFQDYHWTLNEAR